MAGYRSIGKEGGVAVASAAEGVRSSAAAAVAGAHDALRAMVTAERPAVSINWTPLSPHQEMSLRARVRLANENCREWNEFANVRMLRFPGAAEVKARYASNIGRYFYNYVALALAALATSGVLHRADVVILLAVVAFFYVAHEDDIPLVGGFALGERSKGAIVGIASVLTLVFGGVCKYIWSALVFGGTLVVFHALLRIHDEHEDVRLDTNG